jgi:short-subunit dehydrogenase
VKDLKNKWVLITGAASGIGRRLALEFASQGSNVIIADINEAGMRAVAGEVEAKGVKAVTIRADLSRPGEVESLARYAMEETGRVDVLVNNAGIAFVSETINVTIKEWERIMAVNLRGPVLLVHHLLPHMTRRGSGHIVNVASMAGLIGIPGLAPYTVTKFGLVGFSEALRIELAPSGIGVTAVCPGVVDTPIIINSPIRGFSEDMRQLPPMMTTSPERAAKLIVKGVKRNRAKVLPTTAPGRLFYLVKRLAPRTAEFLIKKAYSLWERTPVDS